MKNHYINNFKGLFTSIVIICFLSIIVCILLYEPIDNICSVLNKIAVEKDLGWLSKVGYSFQPITFSAAFTIFWFLFDKFCWKIVAKFGAFTNLNGTWKGTLTTSYVENGISKQLFCVMVIKQTFTKISAECYFADYNTIKVLSSHSTGYNFIIDNRGPVKEIVFSYRNIKENNDSPEANHPGFNRFSIGEHKLIGEYCTFRNQNTFGEIHLEWFNKDTTYRKEIWTKKNFNSKKGK